ncbi:hypothetical protein F5B21DRAFT_497030 [Xylaria acuta]|nr:hypothetical protein F5B21DRAFT_497030 [Xylaria acuta]
MDVGGKQQQIYPHLYARYNESWPQQKPMLYGNKIIGFFDNINYTADAARIPIVFKKNCGCLHLKAGQAHGVCYGDRLVCLVPHQSRRAGFLGLTKIAEGTRAGALTSDLGLLDASLSSSKWKIRSTACRQCPSQSRSVFNMSKQLERRFS